MNYIVVIEKIEIGSFVEGELSRGFSNLLFELDSRLVEREKWGEREKFGKFKRRGISTEVKVRFEKINKKINDRIYWKC